MGPHSLPHTQFSQGATPTSILNVPIRGYRKSGNLPCSVLDPRVPSPTSFIPPRAMRTTPTMFLHGKEVPYSTTENITNVIDPDTNTPLENQYFLCSQVHCVIASTTPIQTHVANAVLVNTTENLLEYQYLIKGPDADIWRRSCANDFG